ncbi:MAG: GTPase ObgE [Caldiserica bacterium]|jgi:GTP-binding protein|nr:GTPase ObgE [Caldisericota bacterium]
MFVDRAKILVRGGKGGNGCVAFRREKFVPRGGPSGGDGGNGGNVYLEANPHLFTLLDFTYKRIYEAPSGKNGQGGRKHGASGEDLVIPVPVGTIVQTGNGQILCDLTEPGQRVLVARGGRGGHGNAFFASSTNRSPRFAEKGEKGEEVELQLELRLIADVGIIGKPNAGKSTLLSALTASTPKIADYPFTTLSPVLGVLTFQDLSTLTLAEIPGLIEGAHAGAGLGHEFLRHALRCRVLLCLLDLTGKPLEEWEMLRNELLLYDSALGNKPYLIALNKCDLLSPEEIAEVRDRFPDNEKELLVISAKEGINLEELKIALKEMVEKAPPVESPLSRSRVVYRLSPRETREFIVSKVSDGIFEIEGDYLKRLVERTDFDNQEAIKRLQRQFDKLGVEKELKKAGIKEGDTVRIGGMEFEFKESGEEA